MLSSPTSIRRFLYVALLTLVSVGMMLVAGTSFYRAHHEVEELFDAQLAESARVLHGLLIETINSSDHHLDVNDLAEPGWLIKSDQPTPGGQPKLPGHKYEHKIAFALFSEDGKLLIRSLSGAELLKEAEVSRVEGFYDLSAGKYAWRIFRVHDPVNKVWLQVAERADVRGELVRDIAKTTIAPGLLLFPIFAFLAFRVIKFGLDPLNSLAQQIAKRDSNDLSPIDVASHLPIELSPLRTAFNSFMNQLSQAMLRERRFTADAAHELRTPLAVLKIHAQNALQANTAEQQKNALERLVQGVDRATRVVEQLLTLARLEPQQSVEALQRVDFKELVKSEVAALAPLAIQKQQEIGFTACDEPVWAQGYPIALSILIKNLLDNAIRYTPSQGRVEIYLQLLQDKLELKVVDTGPGLDEVAQQRVFERFYRQDSGNETGAGLGLSIASKVTELHQGEISLKNAEPQGCVARFVMPALKTN